jgi:hypothetical protein
MRRARLRRQFGPEYDRLAQQMGSRKADAELAARERRVKALNIRDLSPEQQAAYSGDWTAIQEQFVDTPAEAVTAAHTLIWSVMRDRGYPADDRTASLDALSVYHSGVMPGYRQIIGLPTESASTEQLRDAMIRCRAVFEDLTGLREGPGRAGRDRVAAIHERASNGIPAGDGTVPDGTVVDDRTFAENAPVADDRTMAEAPAVTEDRTAETPR